MSESAAESPSNQTDPRRKARARELWQRLLDSRPGPTNGDLIYLARFVPLLSRVAIRSLFSRRLSVEELRELVQHVPKARSAAVKAALKKVDSLSDDDLRFLIIHTKSKEAAQALIERSPTDAVIAFVERTVEELQGTFEELKKKELTSVVMREIDRTL